MTTYTQDSLPVDDAMGPEPDKGDSGMSSVSDDAASEATSELPVADDTSGPGAAEEPIDAGDSPFFSEPSEAEAAAASGDWLERGGPKVLPLERPRVARPAFIPRWIPISIGAAVLVVALIGGLVWFIGAQARIAVPQVTGLDVGVARTRLAQQGLGLTIVEHRYASQAMDTVLSQTPAAGSALKHGEAVNVVVSAGTEEISMPDVVGDGLQLAKGILETKGLDVRVETQPSSQASNTVLATNPGPGQKVRTGEVVTLTVASSGPTTQILLPYNMRGLVVVLDPAPTAGGETDVPLDVARRLRSLIEASGGRVVTTRALADTGTAESVQVRAQRAMVGSATAAIGFSVVPAGQAGVILYTPAATLLQASSSGGLASVISSELAGQSISSRRAATTTDTVLVNPGAPWTRIQLGSFGSRADVASFADPAWEDRAARGIYRAIGSLYGIPGAKKP